MASSNPRRMAGFIASVLFIACVVGGGYYRWQHEHPQSQSKMPPPKRFTDMSQPPSASDVGPLDQSTTRPTINAGAGH